MEQSSLSSHSLVTLFRPSMPSVPDLDFMPLKTSANAASSRLRAANTRNFARRLSTGCSEPLRKIGDLREVGARPSSGGVVV